MKVHPMPTGDNIIFHFNPNRRNPLSEARTLVGLAQKKLKRLPHVFSRVLELPFRSDADVSVEEGPDCFRFVAETDGIGDEVRAHTIEIHPGVMKIVVRDSGSLELTLDELELDMWRFRLPERTRPELASAVFVDGELIVTVPKAEELEDSGDGDVWGDETGSFGGERRNFHSNLKCLSSIEELHDQDLSPLSSSSTAAVAVGGRSTKHSTLYDTLSFSPDFSYFDLSDSLAGSIKMAKFKISEAPSRND